MKFVTYFTADSRTNIKSKTTLDSYTCRCPYDSEVRSERAKKTDELRNRDTVYIRLPWIPQTPRLILIAWYKKPPSAAPLKIGEREMIVCDGLYEAIPVDGEEAPIWQALDRCDNFDQLLDVLKEASPEKSEELHRQTLRAFLDRLIMAGLLELTMHGQLHKSDDAFSENTGRELLVWLRSRRKVHVFNETSAVLWEALDTFRDLDSLSEIAVEAWQDRDPVQSRRLVAVFVATLLDAGLARNK